MILIAHRGNTTGAQPQLENNPSYILRALSAGFDCEIDVWKVEQQLLLGHDEPTYETSFDFLKKEGLWCHAKNLQALAFLLEHNIHCFWHEDDTVTLTSRGYIWTHSSKSEYKYLMQRYSIAVMPEWNETNDFISSCAGVCSDVIEDYRKYKNDS